MDDKDLRKVIDEFTPTYLHLWVSGGKYCFYISRGFTSNGATHTCGFFCLFLTMGRDFLRQRCK